MTPEQFIARWKNNPLSERAGAQAHFDDLCDLLGVDKPRDPENYCFERGAKKASGGDGWADVWKRGHFGWENKKPGRDLKAALKQLTDYALELENPPLLVVSDRERIVIHTAFTGYPDEPRLILLENIGTPENLQTLRRVFTDPERLRPVKSLAAITEDAAGRFGALAEALRARGEPPGRVAHFLTQCLFCMFAEDEFLLPAGIFTRLLEKADDPARATNRIAVLFSAMQSGGDYGDDVIPWFNGGLFATVDVPLLTAANLVELRDAARMDWRAIDPSIFGTLFERGLNPKKRAQLGAHYTDPGTIMKLIVPVIQRPLLAEWAARRDAIAAKLAKSKKQGDKAYRDADAEFHGFLERLKGYRVLDAACGSGNFLYLALKTLKDIERRVNTEAEQLGLHRQVSIEVSPANVLGIEIDPYAAELARVTVWIGEIQWMLQNGYAVSDRPILKPLNTIENRDALVNADGSEAGWPACDAIVGNPPFIGDKKMRGELGYAYVDTVRACYEGRVPGGADFVTYWFEKARAQIDAGKLNAAGLVATDSIRDGASRKVLERVLETTRIFEAWSSEDWVNEGAAVRVSLVGFGPVSAVDRKSRLDGLEVAMIHADLTADIDLTKTPKMLENLGKSYQGVTPSASVKKKLREALGLPDATFNLAGTEARKILQEPATINGEPMAAVVRPYLIADDITTRPLDRFIVNFVGRDEKAATMFEKPFAAISNVRLHRLHTDRFNDFQKYPWWQFGWPRPEMFKALSGLSRYISITRVSKHHLCVWTHPAVTPGDALVVVARDDDTAIGLLQSRIHEIWSLRTGSALEDRPRYTHTTCFETFPFPDGLTPDIPAANYENNENAKAIAATAQELIKLRDHYLNPPEWVDWIITPEEEAAGFPKRPVARSGHEANLKKRTLTNLYNARPAWLDGAHKALDVAVATAYGWTDYTPEMLDDEILRRLLALNLARSNSR